MSDPREFSQRHFRTFVLTGRNCVINADFDWFIVHAIYNTNDNSSFGDHIDENYGVRSYFDVGLTIDNGASHSYLPISPRRVYKVKGTRLSLSVNLLTIGVVIECGTGDCDFSRLRFNEWRDALISELPAGSPLAADDTYKELEIFGLRTFESPLFIGPAMNNYPGFSFRATALAPGLNQVIVAAANACAVITHAVCQQGAGATATWVLKAVDNAMLPADTHFITQGVSNANSCQARDFNKPIRPPNGYAIVLDIVGAGASINFLVNGYYL